MITMEQVSETFKPRKCENQQEFDNMMNQLRRMQTDMTEPTRLRMEELNARRRELGQQLAQLNIELGNVNRERETLREELRHTGGIFYALKKQLIRENPKAIPPTAREEGEA